MRHVKSAADRPPATQRTTDTKVEHAIILDHVGDNLSYRRLCQRIAWQESVDVFQHFHGKSRAAPKVHRRGAVEAKRLHGCGRVRRGAAWRGMVLILCKTALGRKRTHLHQPLQRERDRAANVHDAPPPAAEGAKPNPVHSRVDDATDLQPPKVLQVELHRQRRGGDALLVHLTTGAGPRRTPGCLARRGPSRVASCKPRAALPQTRALFF